MASSITIQGRREFLGNTRTEYFGDTKRSWTISTLNIKGSRTFLSSSKVQYLGDLRKVWTPGGLLFQASRKFLVSNHALYVGDTQRVWTPGGLRFQGARKFLDSNQLEYIGDTFRIVHITLEQFTMSVYITRCILQPPGIPWLQTEVTTAAWCWKLTLQDGTVFGFTSHDEDIIFGDVNYEASTGFVPTAVETSNNMAVDNLEVEGFLDSDRINAADIATGRFDFARVDIFLCNWMNLKDPIVTVRKGTTGQIKNGRYGFQTEIRGLLEAYQQVASTVYQKSCRARLGDSRCQIPIAALVVAGQITRVNPDGTFNTNLSNSDGYFDYGKLTFSSGKNNGCSYEVKTFVGGMFTLFLPTIFDLMAGDTFSAVPGCDGNFSTCRTKYNNVVNFRAEPHIPGNDYQASYPGQGSSNTVSEGSDASRG